jgi:predicted alpha-1,2-mannosidase
MTAITRLLAAQFVLILAASTGATVASPVRVGAANTPLANNPAALVNTFIGTAGGGNVFPGPDVPFGMIQWSPDSYPNRPYGGGYDYPDTMFRGFSLTHLSGPGCRAYGDVPIEPFTGTIPAGTAPSAFMQPLSHNGEIGRAGYYSVETGVPSIRTELSATRRSAMARFTYPATTRARLLLKLLDSQNGTAAATARLVGRTEVQGSATSGYFCGNPHTYTVHFDIVFNRPFTAPRMIAKTGQQPGPDAMLLTFNTTIHRVLLAKVGISFVSARNAKQNRQNDNPGWNFNAVAGSARKVWNRLLGKIQIGGSVRAREQLFYTALYHSLLHPNIWSDANGQYMGFDDRVHTLPAGHVQYANYSGWDTYHSQAQLVATVAPRQAGDQVTSLLNDNAQTGVLPQWGFANSDDYVMVGDPALSIVADTYAFGARSFNTRIALSDMLRQATTVNRVRYGAAIEQQYGYLPQDATYGCCSPHGFVASLLEYDQADFALSRYAAAMGDARDATMLTKRAQNWQNIFNPAGDLMEAKFMDGQFGTGYALNSGEGMVEGSASQYRWVVPFNHQSLIAAMGGDDTVNPMLDAFFAHLDGKSAACAQLTNEFELGVQYFYNYTGEPWKTQTVVNRLRSRVFHDSTTFTDNNDDLGALSSQLVWSMIGLYPEISGSAQLVINGPEFPLEVIHLGDGKTIKVTAPGASTHNFYIRTLTINGRASDRLWLDSSFVMTGGRLAFIMGPKPDIDWGAAPVDAPPSYGAQYVAAIGFARPPHGESGHIALGPGGAASTGIGIQSTWRLRQTINWTASATSGVGVSPSDGSFRVGPDGRVSLPVRITAGNAEGRYIVTFQLNSSTQRPVARVLLAVSVALPGDLWPFYNNTGIGSDTLGSAASFDGGRFAYSAQALGAGKPKGVKPGAAFTTPDGFTYIWPDVPPNQPDNIQAAGQTIQLRPTRGKTEIGLLGSAANVGRTASHGVLTVHYAVGSSLRIRVGFSDWILGAGSFQPLAGNMKAVTTSHRDCTSRCRTDPTIAYVYSLAVALTPGRTVVAITLPSTVSQGQFHVFDVAFK